MACKPMISFMFFYLLIIAPITSFELSSPSASPFGSPSASPSVSPSNSPSNLRSSTPFPSPSPSNSHSPLSSSSPAPVPVGGDNDEDVLYDAEPQFEYFKEKFDKSYKTQEEQDYRFSIFKDNLLLAVRNQKLDPAASHGVTKYSDLTQIEFFNTFLGDESKYIQNHRVLTDHDQASILPPTTDLDAYGWTGRDPDPSDDTAYNLWVGPHYTPLNTRQLVVPVLADEEQIIANIVKYGPVSVGFDATFMQTYAGGGVSCPATCSNQANHGAVIVSYGTFALYVPGTGPLVPYWSIRNTDSPIRPGDEDEYWLCRSTQNVCGVNSMVSTVPAALAH